MTVPVDTVFLAIQAGVRLYQGLRSAYVDSVRGAAITLPLPRAPLAPPVATMVSRFQQPGNEPPAGSKLATIIGTVVAGQPLNSQDEAFLTSAFLLDQAKDQRPAAGATPAEIAIFETVTAASSHGVLAMLEVRQWADGQAGAADAVRTGIGTLIEVAVFWFANKPGAISMRHPEGRALKAFLIGIQDVDFSTASMDEITSRMLTGILQSVASEPNALVGGKREGLLVTNTAKALSTAIAERLASKPAAGAERDSIASWAELIAGTLVKAGTRTVLTDPVLFLGVKEGAQSEVAKELGGALLDLVVPPGTNGWPQLQSLLSGNGLETVARAALAAVGRHPDIINPTGGSSNGVHKLIGSLATAFAAFKPSGGIGTAFPEIAALVLEKTADNLDALWGVAEHDDPGRNLLVIAVRHVLDALKQATQGKADPLFARDQVVALVDAVLTEVTANPHWVTTRFDDLDGEPCLAVALEAALAAMAGRSIFSMTGADRLAVLKAALSAAGRRLALLHAVPALPGTPPGPGSGEVAVAAIIDTVFTGLAAPADAAAQWRLARGATAVALLEIAFYRFATLPAGDAALPTQLKVLRKAVDDFAAGSIDLDGFAGQLGTGLKAAA